MRKTDDLPERKRPTLDELLQVKRLEKPSPEFWSVFERELQEKQLRALVKPGRRERFWTLLAPKMAVLVPVSAVSGIAVMVLASFWIGWKGPADSLVAEDFSEMGEEELVSENGLAGDSDAAVQARLVDSRFVVDALVPERKVGQSFRTVSTPETFVASTDGTAHYVTNVFTAGTGDTGGLAERATEF